MATLTKTRVVYASATTSVVTEHGLAVSIIAGEAWDARDPVVVDHPQIFSAWPLVRTSTQGVVRVEDL